jgi:hypothetical protein
VVSQRIGDAPVPKKTLHAMRTERLSIVAAVRCGVDATDAEEKLTTQNVEEKVPQSSKS